MVTKDLFYLLPALSVVVFSLIERLIFDRTSLSNKTKPILLMVILNLVVSIGFAAIILIPFVMLVAPLQLFSIAQLDISGFAKVVLSILILDFIMYVTHRLHHSIPILWRLHRLHHSDPEINAQTTLLHHPLEVISNTLLLILGAVILDIPAICIFYYSIILGLHSAFTHIHVRIPAQAEKIMRWFFVTPNYHRRHHAKELAISNTNFGMVFVYWDWLFKTNLFHDDKELIDYGISSKEAPKEINIWHFPLNPFR